MIKIPLYKEVILMSFQCDHCGYKNNEIQSGGKVQEQGIRYIVKITDKKVTSAFRKNIQQLFLRSFSYLGFKQTSCQV